MADIAAAKIHTDLEPAEARAARPRIEGRSPWQLAWERLRRDRVAMGSLVVIVGIVLMALLAPVIAAITGHGPDEQFRETGLTPRVISGMEEARLIFLAARHAIDLSPTTPNLEGGPA